MREESSRRWRGTARARSEPATEVWLPDTVRRTGTFALMVAPAAGIWLSTVPIGWLLEMYFTV